MGTGVVSMILIQLPFAKSFLFMLATLLWQFNIVLFSVFSVLYLLRWLLFPHEAKQIFNHPNELVFRCYTDGACNHTKWLLSFGIGLYGEVAVHIAQALWYIDVF